MNKEQALRVFFNGFEWKAYPNTAVPDAAEFPYITYTMATDSFSGQPVSLTVQLWDYTTQEYPLNRKVTEIAEAIGYGGKVIPCDGGYIWLKRGSPWCNNATGEGDNRVKVRQLNVTAEYLTFN